MTASLYLGVGRLNLIHVLYFAFSQRWAIAPPHDKFSKTAMSCKMPALTAILTRYITQYTHRSIWVNKVHSIITTYVPKEFFKLCYCSANLTEFLIKYFSIDIVIDINMCMDEQILKSEMQYFY